MAIACPVDLDTLKLRAEIQSIFMRASQSIPRASVISVADLNTPRQSSTTTLPNSELPGTVTESFAERWESARDRAVKARSDAAQAQPHQPAEVGRQQYAFAYDAVTIEELERAVTVMRSPIGDRP